ncbi:unnamed protein product, partial [Ectocarpus sp. 12 AP-2014]
GAWSCQVDSTPEKRKITRRWKSQLLASGEAHPSALSPLSRPSLPAVIDQLIRCGKSQALSSLLWAWRYCCTAFFLHGEQVEGNHQKQKLLAKQGPLYRQGVGGSKH